MGASLVLESGAPVAPAAVSNLPDPRTDAALKALLTSTHPTYRAGVHDWSTAERRLFGGSPALSELQPFAGESAADYAIRQRKGTLIPFPRLFAAANAGHILRQMPTPNYGTLGAVRPRKERTGAPTLAELIDYNCDGVGADGTQWRAWWAGVTAAIHGPGFGWIYVEAPVRDQIRARLGRPGALPTTAEDVRAGLRPYLVHIPPGRVPNHHVQDGRREWAIVRTPVRAPRLEEGEFRGNDGGLGYMLLVRRGWLGFGGRFARGGWWTYDPEFVPLATGDWSRTRGEIPMCAYVYEASEGLAPPAGGDGVRIVERESYGGLGEEALTEAFLASRGSARYAPVTSYPAIARSPTLELGNVMIALLDAVSERDYDAREAAASGLTAAGVDPNGGLDEDGNPLQNNFNDYAYMHAARARVKALPYSTVETGFDAQGRPIREVVTPTLTDDSAGAVPAEVYEKLIASKFAEAREIMARELVSAPQSSGASKAAGFAEGKSPRLALLAGNLETAQNTALHFLELRAGAVEPRGFVTLPREYDLAPVLDTIDRALLRLRDAGLTSPTLAVELVMRALDEDGLLTDDATREAVKAELEAAAERATTQPTALERLLGGGAPPPEPAPTPEPVP